MELLRDPADRPPDPAGHPAPDRQPEVAADEALVCASCGHPITRESERIEVDGSHESVRVNLAGMLFRIGCFARAPGCRAVGESSTHWTWFPGYAWQVVVCARCADHLGWAFRSEGGRFWGLVLDRLRAGAGM
jgi:hypothetical protein